MGVEMRPWDIRNKISLCVSTENIVFFSRDFRNKS